MSFLPGAHTLAADVALFWRRSYGSVTARERDCRGITIQDPCKFMNYSTDFKSIRNEVSPEEWQTRLDIGSEPVARMKQPPFAVAQSGAGLSIAPLFPDYATEDGRSIRATCSFRRRITICAFVNVLHC